jgi:hypothetical protein
MRLSNGFRNRIIGGGVLASLILLAESMLGTGSSFAQMSLPLDIDLTTNETESEPTEPAALEAVESDGSQPIPDVPLQPPPPLRPVDDMGEASSNGQVNAGEDPLPDLSEPPSQMPSAETPPADSTAEELAQVIVGRDIDTAVSTLEQDGWVVVAHTPRTVQLDRGQQGLDLQVDSSTGQVVDLDLVDLI